MQPHASVAACRPTPFASGSSCRRAGGCPFGVLLGVWATLAAGAEPVEPGDGAVDLRAVPIVRVATAPEPGDEPLDAEAARARREALERPPRLMAEPTTPAVLASSRTRASTAPADAAVRSGGVPVSSTDREAGARAVAAPEAGGPAVAAPDARPGTAVSVGADAPAEEVHANAIASPAGAHSPRPAGSEERIPAVHAAAFAIGAAEREDDLGAADEPPAPASRTGAAPSPRRGDDAGARGPHTEPLSLVANGFLPRSAKAHAGREGHAGDAPRPGLARSSSSPRAGLGGGPAAGAGLPRESLDGRDETRDWKLARGRWGLERGGRLSMELDSGYRLSLKPRRSGLVLSIRRNF